LKLLCSATTRHVALLATLVLLAGSAAALADVEPNDIISQAEGPIAGGTQITGTLGTPDDVDYFYFYVQGQQQIHLTATLADAEECGYQLEDTDGARLPSDYTTPPGLNRYYVHIYGSEFCTPGPWSFEVDPGSAVVSGPSIDRSFVQTGEPNESEAQAEGPLAGGVNYRGSIDTSNDEDWFFFYVAPGTHQIDVAVTNPTTSGCNAQVTLPEALDTYGEPSGASGDSTTYGHVDVTLTGPARYYLSAGSSCSGAWQFRIDPSDALAPSLPAVAPLPHVAPPKPHVSIACKRARTSVAKLTHRVRVLTKEIAHAHGRHARRVLSKYRRTAKRQLAAAAGRRKRLCPHGR